MIAYSLKKIVEMVPSAIEHVKQASVEEDYPLSNRDNVIASALAIEYHKHVDGAPVDISIIEKVACAVDLYGVSDTVAELSNRLVESQEALSLADLVDTKSEFQVKQASFSGDLAGFSNVSDLAEIATQLYKEARDLGVDPTEDVSRYSGHAFLDKKAAVEALAARYQASGEVGFAKIAVALGKMDTTSLKPETVQDICTTITGMDKQAQLNALGFDFYREALLTKQAEIVSALRVRIAGTEVPYETIERVGKSRFAQYIGDDVAKEMDGGPQNFKQVLETLPLDLQQLALNLTKNV